MGGSGSGRRPSLNTKDTVEECLGLSVSFLHRQGYLQSDNSWSVGWSRNGKITDMINGRTESGRIVLEYYKEQEAIRQTVEIVYTPCNYGGERPWFICPGMVDGVVCDRRVGKLFCGEMFFCRHCYDLAYRSQRETREDRLLIKAQRIRKRLGGSTDITHDFPEKPKGMHWKTYWQLFEQQNEALTESMRLTGERFGF